MGQPFATYNTDRSPILFPVHEHRVGYQTGNLWSQARDYKAIVRSDKDILLNIVGSGYKIVHNKELFQAIEDCMVNEMLPDHFEGMQVKDKVSGWGRMCFREYVFPAIKCKVHYSTSDIGFRILVQNGYGGSALRIHSGAIDFYCTNGMIHGEFHSTYRRHTSGIVIGNLSATIQAALLQFTKQQDVWAEWTKKSVKLDQVAELFDKVSTSIKMREGLLEQYERESDARGKTVWAVYSTLTHYASHNDGQFTLRASVEEADTVASTMLTRELNVCKWIQLPEFKKLEVVDA